MKRFGLLTGLFLILSSMAGISHSVIEAQSPTSTPRYAHGSFFIQNIGQFDPSVLYYAFTDQGPIVVTADSLWFFTSTRIDPHRYPDQFPANEPPQIETAPVQLRFRDANPAVRLEPATALATRINYLTGSDQSVWHMNVPTWESVRYHNLYPGIDLELAPTATGQLARRFIVDAGADLSQIQLEINGADSTTLTAEGLTISTSVGVKDLSLFEVVTETGVVARQSQTMQPSLEGSILHAPFTTQTPAAINAPNDEIGFYYAFGGSGGEWVLGMDSSGGNTYFAGTTLSPNFPIQNQNPIHGSIHGGPNDAFVGHVNSSGQLQYLTFLAGSGREEIYALVIDSSTNPDTLMVTGFSNSPNFPVDGYKQTPPAGSCTFGASTEPCYDAVVARISLDGQAYHDSTFMGGNSHDYGYSVATGRDPSGSDTREIYIVGQTDSTNYYTPTGGWDSSFGGVSDAFVTIFRSDLKVVNASSFVGGNQFDTASSVVLDSNYYPYIVGRTDGNFPTAAPSGFTPFQATYQGGGDMFVTQLDPDLGDVYYSTYVGGSALDFANQVNLPGGTYRANVVGVTRSSNFPQAGDGTGIPDTSYNGGADAVFFQITGEGDDLNFATFWGGNGNDYGTTLDSPNSNIYYIAGETSSTNLPTTPDAYRRGLGQTPSGFITRFWYLAGTANLEYGTYVYQSGSNHGPSSIYTMDVVNNDVYAGGFDGGSAVVYKFTHTSTDKNLVMIPLVRK